MKLLLAIAVTIAGCGTAKRAATPAADRRVSELRSAVDAWKADLEAGSDRASGWPSATDCDGTLWAGIARAAGVTSVKLDLAEASPGVIWRRPGVNCYPNGSASSVSRDMLVGYMYGEWVSGNRGALERLHSFGASHGWVMGQGDKTRTILSPDGIGLLERAVNHLGGARGPSEWIPVACLPVSKDFEEHLQVIGSLFTGDVSDDLLEPCAEALSGLHNKRLGDALFAAASGVYTGDMGPAFSLLLDPGYQCPSYVRGAPTYCLVHKLLAAHTVLKRYPAE